MKEKEHTKSYDDSMSCKDISWVANHNLEMARSIGTFCKALLGSDLLYFPSRGVPMERGISLFYFYP